MKRFMADDVCKHLNERRRQSEGSEGRGVRGSQGSEGKWLHAPTHSPQTHLKQLSLICRLGKH